MLAVIVTPSLLCEPCGKRAAHVHFIPWLEAPVRAVLACDGCEPGGDDGEWYTLAEVERDGGLQRAVGRAERTSAGLVEWVKGLTASDAAPAGRPSREGAPMTVAQAAEHENVSERTIYRLAPELEADRGAWKIGSHWRIDPKALDRRRVQASRPGGKQKNAPTRKRRPKVRNATGTGTDDMGWPS